ncbi:MAG: hypothetical protein NC489_08925 [Ruminococcus flavefaciens]|nr:hypothetical protein [Ruminococcus flavefaciens]
MVKPGLVEVLKKYRIHERVNLDVLIQDPEHCSAYVQFLDYGPDAPDIYDFAIFHGDTLLLHAQIDKGFRTDLGSYVEVITCTSTIPQ